MAKKRSNFIEEHIEKVVLIIVAIGCIYPLYRYVFSSRDAINFDGRRFRPGQLDIYVGEQAEKLRERLNREPIAKPPYESQSVRFLAKMNSAVDINANIAWPAPTSAERKIEKKYRIPVVGRVKDMAAEHIRAAAYVPKVEITAGNVNDKASYEPNDIDLMTVQASFDIGALSDSFQECFAGQELPEEWRDTVLARPVFAAVGLQRQRLGENGAWGQWEKVPRAKIDPYRADFRVIEEVSGLSSGGVMVRLLKLGEPRMQASLLQPEPYKMASAEEEWFAPILHRKFLMNQRDREAQGRRETIAGERTEDRGRSRAERERRTRSAKTTTSTTGPAGYFDTMAKGPAGGTGSRKRSERRSEQTQAPAEQFSRDVKTTGDSEIRDEFDKISLAGKDVSSLREPVVFWAYDDTAEPGNSYRYRVRLGVLNPVAGTGQVQAEDAEYDSKVILWSDFSDVTKPVAIPNRLYFFPVNVQETTMSVDVQVCRYALGYWHSEQFMVRRGEVIGKAVKVEPGEQDKDVTLPETIDYGTGAVLVDVVAVNDWAGDKNLQSRHYFDMLYSFDGTSIERVAVRQMYWPEELRAKYSEIKTLERRPKEAFRAWSSTSVTGGRRVLPGAPTDRGGAGGYEEEMMRIQMQMQKQKR